MCIAISKPKETLIPHTYLEQSWKNNDDGAGFMYAEQGKLHIQKGFLSFDHFMSKYTPHEEKPCVVHFRIATHGHINKDNTHPFQVSETLGFVHNGIISNVSCASDVSKNDTHHFNEQYLKKLYEQDKNFIYKDIYKNLIAKFIGSSKLIFLNNEGESTIINKSLGKEDNGVWYSNHSYKPSTPTPLPNYQPIKNNSVAPPQNVFKQGSDVYVKHPRCKGRGIIQYFTGNTMVGVQMYGDTQVSLLPMQCLTPWINKFNNPYKLNDFVILKDSNDLLTGVVQGTSKNKVWVQWLNDYLLPEGKVIQLQASDLELWEFPLGD